MSTFDQKVILKEKIFSLQAEVSKILSIDNDVDKFLDNSTILDEWEKIIPDAEYGIFVIAILNNIKRKIIIDKINNLHIMTIKLLGEYKTYKKSRVISSVW